MEDRIRTAIEKALHTCGLQATHFSLEHPDNPSFGEYATNVAMVAHKGGGETPRECALRIVSLLKEENVPHVSEITIAGPGFINFTLNRAFYQTVLGDALTHAAEWGRNRSMKEREILLEYTSPNLFKPLHIGNLVGNIVGESLARLFEESGATVHRINYPSDIGLTVAKGVWGITKTGGAPSSVEDLGAAYRAGNDAYEEGGPGKEEIDEVNRKLYEGSDETLALIRKKGIETSLARLRELMSQLGTSFDYEFFESDAAPLGLEAVLDGRDREVMKSSEGAIVYEGEKHGLHTRVFINSKGFPTYEAKDIGNFILKDRRFPGWTHSYIVTGAEQTEYFRVIISAIRELCSVPADKVFEHIKTGFLTLTTGKMSSRKGNVLTGESLLLEMKERSLAVAEESRASDKEALSRMVAVAALKYQILRQSLGSDITFDKEQALSLQGDSGPYLQYTHARALSVVKKAEELKIYPVVEDAPETVSSLERILCRYPEVVLRAGNEKAPHQVVTYLTLLAATFNAFYATERIADATDRYAPFKAALASITATTLNKGLSLLGMEVPGEM